MNVSSPVKLYMTIPEAVAASGISRTRLYEVIRTGAIAGVRKSGARTLLSVEGLKSYLDGLPEICAAH